MSDDPEQSVEFILGRLAHEQETNRKLLVLLLRAAEALEKYTSYPIGMVMSATLRESGRSVLAELRKAAE